MTCCPQLPVRCGLHSVELLLKNVGLRIPDRYVQPDRLSVMRAGGVDVAAGLRHSRQVSEDLGLVIGRSELAHHRQRQLQGRCGIVGHSGAQPVLPDLHQRTGVLRLVAELFHHCGGPAQFRCRIADAAFFYVSMSSTVITEALARQGLNAQWLQPLDENIDRSRPLLQIDKIVGRDSGMTNVRRLPMNFSELNRLLLELVDLDVWAEHAATLLQGTDLDGIPPWPYFVHEREA